MVTLEKLAKEYGLRVVGGGSGVGEDVKGLGVLDTDEIAERTALQWQ